MSQFEYDEPVVVKPDEAITIKIDPVDPEKVKKLFEEVYKVTSNPPAIK